MRAAMHAIRRVLAISALLAVPAHSAVCSVNSERHEFRLLAGYSPNSPTLIGTATDRHFAMVELGYSYRCRSSREVSLSYTAAIIPAGILRQPAETTRNIPRHSVYGFGVMPVGFLVTFLRPRKVQLVAEANGGIIASTEPIPIRAPDATGLNFLFDFGAGVRIRVRDRSALTFGYRFLHISNAYTTDFNPGVDNNVLYISYSLFK